MLEAKFLPQRRQLQVPSCVRLHSSPHAEGNRGNPAPNIRADFVAELNLLTETGAAPVELEMKNESEGVKTSQKSAKTAAELESMIMAELREYPECESAAVAVIRPTSVEP